MKHSRDAEANNMIHIGSDHRSVMARFVIPVSKQKDSPKRIIHYRERTTRIKSTKMRSLKRLQNSKNDTVSLKGESCKNPLSLNIKESQRARKLNQKMSKINAPKTPQKTLKKQQGKMKQQPRETNLTKNRRKRRSEKDRIRRRQRSSRKRRHR